MRLAAGFLAIMAFAAPPPAFEVASIKPSKVNLGHDGEIALDPGRLVVRNATLKRLIVDAWGVSYTRIADGPKWLDTDEFDIEAKAENPATPAELKVMLRTLLAERFRFEFRRETRKGHAYILTTVASGPKLTAKSDKNGPGVMRFHGTLGEFANILSTEIAIPVLDDPTLPSRPDPVPVTVIDKTGIEGIHDISIVFLPDTGADAFTLWRLALQEQLGLRLEPAGTQVEVLVIERAEKPLPE